MKLAAPKTTPALTLALALCRAGCSVIPVGVDKKPLYAWKHRQHVQATPDEVQAEAALPGATGFALVGGAVSGRVEVLDFDIPAFYDEFMALAPAWVRTLPAQQTGGGGYQIWYRRTPSAEDLEAEAGLEGEPLLKKRKERHGNKKLAHAAQDGGKPEIAIETRGEGGYALIPGSAHPSGNTYTALNDYSVPVTISDAQAEELLALARTLCQAPVKAKKTAPAPVTQPLFADAPAQPLQTGQTEVIAAFNAVHSVESMLERCGYTRAEAGRWARPGGSAASVTVLDNRSYHHSSNDVLNDENPHDAFDLFTVYECGGDVRSAVRNAAHLLGLAGPARGKAPVMRLKSSGVSTGTAPAQPAPAARQQGQEPSMLEMETVFAATSAAQNTIYRYHQEWQNWWVYRGGCYTSVLPEVMLQRVHAALRAAGCDNVRPRGVQDVLDGYGRWDDVGSPAIHSDAWLLNTQNGLLNLRTHTLEPHTPGTFSIVQSAAEFIPGAVSHEWEQFLMHAVPDEADRLTLQMYAGLCLTADITPQRALLLIGNGGTGKSTFVRVLEAVLGGLAGSSAIENIRDGSFLLGTLVGKRMVTVSELPKKFDWLAFKRVTGGDPMTVDVKNRTPYTIRLDSKIIILSNVIPHLGDDAGNGSLTRRFLPVAFNVRPTEPDSDLPNRLAHESQLPGVLNWMLSGLAELQRRGMQFPQTNNHSALEREIVSESNRVIAFVEDRVEPRDGAFLSGSSLYGAYQNWCSENGNAPLASNRFAAQLGQALTYHNIQAQPERTKQARGWRGLILV